MKKILVISILSIFVIIPIKTNAQIIKTEIFYPVYVAYSSGFPVDCIDNLLGEPDDIFCTAIDDTENMFAWLIYSIDIPDKAEIIDITYRTIVNYENQQYLWEDPYPADWPSCYPVNGYKIYYGSEQAVDTIYGGMAQNPDEETHGGHPVDDWGTRALTGADVSAQLLGELNGYGGVLRMNNALTSSTTMHIDTLQLSISYYIEEVSQEYHETFTDTLSSVLPESTTGILGLSASLFGFITLLFVGKRFLG